MIKICYLNDKILKYLKKSEDLQIKSQKILKGLLNKKCKEFYID
jgi:hypothetical protein